MVKPVTVIGLEVPVPVIDPGLEVTVYPVMDVLPFTEGAVKVTEACWLPAVADPMVGAPGFVATKAYWSPIAYKLAALVGKLKEVAVTVYGLPPLTEPKADSA